MQNKGLIKFFAIIFALVSIYQLSFTFVAGNIQDDAKAYANGDSAKELKYLDSIGKVEVYPVLGYTYNEVRDKQINKGLDLEGGINVILEISVKDIIKGLANNSDNPVLNKALDDAAKNRQGNQDYIDAFFIAFDESKGNLKLADPSLFTNRIMGDEVNIRMTDEEVKAVIKRKVNESIDSAFRVLTERIDKFGVVQPNIQKLGESGRILVELPGAKDIDRVKKLLQSTAQLEFWETYKSNDLQNFLLAANEALKATEKAEEPVKEETATSAIDSLLTKNDSAAAPAAGANPLFEKLAPSPAGSTIIGMAAVQDTAKVNEYFKRPEIRSLLTGELSNVRFAWGKEDIKNSPGALQLYALKGNRKNEPPLSGNVITDAQPSFDQFGKPSVEMQMNGAGAREWEQLTGKSFREQIGIAIVLDNVVYSAPVASEAIAGGRSQISGTFDIAETKDLANILRAGKLPASADIIQSEVVGPSLGQEAIDNGMMSSLVGLLVIFLWMIVYYGRAGWYANIALAVNLLFLFGVLASIGAVLTLPGIAGIVLTMGTAVDANIIIYERAKEELRLGKTLDEAIKAAFSWKGAMSAITDANVTTFLTGLILLIFGSGPVKGFATTLLIGILTSLFTAIFVTRVLLDMAARKNNSLTFTTAMSKNWFTNVNIDFLGKKKLAYIISSLLIIGSFISFSVNGFDQGVDFVGGRTFQVRFDKDVSADEVESDLVKAFGSADAKVFGDASQLRITTKYKVDEATVEADQEVNRMLYESLRKYYTKDLTYEQFNNTYEGKQFGVMQASKVGPTIADDIKTDAYWSVFGSLVIVFLYLMISFRKWQYSLGAVAAVAHDVIIVLGIYSACYAFMPFQMEIDQHFIAAILTVIGYSLNDTVIVFDRVREYVAGKHRGNFHEIVNKSINVTLARTFNTSFTVLVVLLIMFIFGGESIRGFVFAMLVGIGVGTYSSLFVATPILVDTVSKKEKNKIEQEHNEEAA